jgi:hypothetical protein
MINKSVTLFYHVISYLLLFVIKPIFQAISHKSHHRLKSFKRLQAIIAVVHAAAKGGPEGRFHFGFLLIRKGLRFMETNYKYLFDVRMRQIAPHCFQ